MKLSLKIFLSILFIAFLSLVSLLLIYESSFNVFIKKIFLTVLILPVVTMFIFLFKKNKILYNKKDQSDRLDRLYKSAKNLFSIAHDFYNDALLLITGFFSDSKDYKLQFEENNSSEELYDKVDALIRNLDKFAESILLINSNYLNVLKGQKASHVDRNDFNKMVMDFKYNSEILSSFILSIITNMDKFSKPLSEGIYLIKVKINNFLDNISKWQKELSDENSEKNFNKIIGSYGVQNKEFEKIFALINNNFNNLEKNLVHIVDMVKEIDQNTHVIQEVSEKIRLLSINASIEATRAGESGKGFKIVSEEVKKLSHDTQTSVKIIVPNIKNTKNIVASVINEFKMQGDEIINKINIQKDEFNRFYEILKDYYNDLNSLFSSVSEVINQINKNIDQITPVFQSSNLSMQELSNLNNIIINFLNENKNVMEAVINSIDENKKDEALKAIINCVQNEITTESEVEVINQLIDKFKINININRTDNKKSADIEIF
jgi:methyl-accepting chemotaxis protein